jgi:two-component system LytT family sensor kinase
MEIKKYTKSAGLLFRMSVRGLFYYFFLHLFLEEFKLEFNLDSFLITGALFLGYLAISAFNVKVLIKRFFDKKKYIRYVLYSVISLFAYAYIANIFVRITLSAYNEIDNKTLFTSDGSGYFIFIGLILIGLEVYFYFSDKWLRMRENLAIFDKEKKEAELAALKAQINPHFLFNTLNNIYSLSLEKSEKVPGSILQLSDLMSYVLYECNKEKVNLKNEIDFLKSYIELEKERFEDNLKAEFIPSILYPESKIAPLLFFPFVENAFKHFRVEGEEKPEISISILQGIEKNIVFKVINPVSDEQINGDNPYSGIGIKNIKEQLLYLYPEKHELKIESKDKQFIVELKIELE